MKITMSNQGNLRNFTKFIRGIDFSNKNYLEIVCDAKWITVHPANLVLAAALAIKVGKSNTEITGNLPSSAAVLDRMGLFEYANKKSPFRLKPRKSAGQYIPIKVIKSAEDQSSFIADMIPLLHLNEEKSDVVKYIIGELVRNVLEHSSAKDGAVVAAQYSSKTNRISIGICDTGIGVWRSMSNVWHPRTDLDAIYLALTPGITGTTQKEGGTSENAGAGLFFIKSIAKITRSYFAIYSGSGEFLLTKHDKRIKGLPRLYSDARRDPHSSVDDAPYFGGTLVAVDISLNDTPAFTNLLSAIGKVYDDAIRERKRAKYREPKFI